MRDKASHGDGGSEFISHKRDFEGSADLDPELWLIQISMVAHFVDSKCTRRSSEDFSILFLSLKTDVQPHIAAAQHLAHST